MPVLISSIDSLTIFRVHAGIRSKRLGAFPVLSIRRIADRSIRFSRRWRSTFCHRGVDAHFRSEMLKDQAFGTELQFVTAIERSGRVANIVDVVDFLASDASRWVTGQVIAASGGWRL